MELRYNGQHGDACVGIIQLEHKSLRSMVALRAYKQVILHHSCPYIEHHKHIYVAKIIKRHGIAI